MQNNVLSPLTMILKMPGYSKRPAFTVSMIETSLELAGHSKGETGRTRLADSVEIYIRRMVSHCAVGVHIPYTASEQWLRPRTIKSLLAPSSRKRIQFVDQRHRLWDAVVDYLRPLYESIGANNALELLAWDLYVITLATRYKTEVTLSPERTLLLISELDKLSELNAECRMRLATIAGILNCFEPNTDGPFLRFFPRATEVLIYERLEEIMEDAYYLEASRLRRFLGVKQNVASIKRDLRKVLSHISHKSAWAKGLVGIGSATIMGGKGSAKVLEKLVQLIPSLGSHGQWPVLTDVHVPSLGNQEAYIQIIRGMSGENFYRLQSGGKLKNN